MNNIVLNGFCAKAQQIKSKKNNKSYDVVEFFIPSLSGNLKFFQPATDVFNSVIDDKLKSLVVDYTITCKPSLRYDGSFQLQVIKVEKKK